MQYVLSALAAFIATSGVGHITSASDIGTPDRQVSQGPTHILFAFVDHFEPGDPAQVDMWADDYMAMASQHTDADGRHPVHSYFLMWPACFDIDQQLVTLNTVTYNGLGEVEFHLHHGTLDERRRPEASATADMVAMTTEARDAWCRNGAWVTAERVPQHPFAFIHGMWALDNSRIATPFDPNDPRPVACGVNEELRMLSQLGCFADFTFPAYGSMEPLITDSLFWVRDDESPASYKNSENCRMVEVGGSQFGDLMIIEGPKTNTNIGVGIGCGGAVHEDPATLARMDEWVGHNVHVGGRDDWIFVKVYTHGCMYDLTTPVSWDHFFGESAHQFYSDIEAKYNDGVNWKLHYVSAREMYNIARAAEAGMTGDPGHYRDFIIPAYANMVIATTNQYRLISYHPEWVLLEVLDTSVDVEMSFREFEPCATVEESEDLTRPLYSWYGSDATVDPGASGELHFVDTSPSRYYRISTSLCASASADLDGDGDVDMDDFAILVEQLSGPTPDRVFVESDGDLMIEAEHFASRIDGCGTGAGSAWLDMTGDGSLGDGYLAALPDVGRLITGSYIAPDSPSVSYQVLFTTPGTYYLWMKGWGAVWYGDTIHYGLDGQPTSSDHVDSAALWIVDGFSWRSQRWDWQRPTLDVTSTGWHTVDFWMCKDGARIDRIHLTTCPQDYPPIGVPATTRLGDLDQDGDIDLADFALFAANFTGPQ